MQLWVRTMQVIWVYRDTTRAKECRCELLISKVEFIAMLRVPPSVHGSTSDCPVCHVRPGASTFEASATRSPGSFFDDEQCNLSSAPSTRRYSCTNKTCGWMCDRNSDMHALRSRLPCWSNNRNILQSDGPFTAATNYHPVRFRARPIPAELNF